MSYAAFNFKEWIDEHRHLMKPPVGNQQVYTDTSNFIVMVVGGPNERTDYHFNETEEFFYMLEGDMNLRLFVEGRPQDTPIKEGEIFLLPPRVLHSPQRPANTIGLVMEVKRQADMMDGVVWKCENCHETVYEEYFHLVDIVAQMKEIIQKYYASIDLHTCSACGYVQTIPGN